MFRYGGGLVGHGGVACGGFHGPLGFLRFSEGHLLIKLVGLNKISIFIMFFSKCELDLRCVSCENYYNNETYQIF